VGGDGSSIRIINSVAVGARIAGSSTVTASLALTVGATTNARHDGEANGVTVGLLVGIGASKAYLSATGATTATIGAGAQLAAASVSIGANSTVENNARVSAGSGGVVSGGSVSIETINSAAARTIVEDTAFNATPTRFTAGTEVSISANTIIAFNGRISANGGGAISGTGSTVDHRVDADTTARLGSRNVVMAQSFSAQATTTLSKPELSDGGSPVDNISGITVGLLAGGAGGDTDIILDVDTRVEIGESASITATGGNIALAALNSGEIYDSIALTTGGLAAFGRTVAEVGTADSPATLQATVDIGENARLITTAILSASARGNGSYKVDVSLDAYGLSSGGGASTELVLRPVNTVRFGQGSLARAGGNIMVAAGTGNDFVADQYTLEANTDLVAGSAIPIGSTSATADFLATNAIVVATGAVVETSADVRLDTDRVGLTTIKARAKNTNWASSLGDAITAGMGGTVSYDGDLTTRALGYVEVDGTVRTGVDRNRTLILSGGLGPTDPVAAITQQGITFTVAEVEASQALFDEMTRAFAKAAEFGPASNPINAALYEASLSQGRFMRDQLLSQGLAILEINPDNPSEQQLVPVRETRPQVTIAPIFSATGDVFVRAGSLVGTGTLETPRDLAIRIENRTPANIVIRGITVAPSLGKVYLNGLEVGSNADVLARNGTQLPGAPDLPSERRDTNLTFNSGTASSPQITITQATLPPREGGSSYPRPVITVAGDITAPTTEYTVTGDVDYFANGSVITKSSTIIVGGAVSIGPVLTYAPAGDLSARLVADSRFWAWLNDPSIGTSPAVAAPTDAVTALVNQAQTRPSLYGQIIRINANTINVNGIIQSGRASYDLVLGTRASDAIAQAIRSGASGLVGLSGVNEAALDTGEFKIFYDATNRRIIVADMQTGGGSITIEGRIFSTGQGKIRSLGAQADINVTNNTQYDLVVNRLDASRRGEGLVTITDRNQGWQGVTSVAPDGWLAVPGWVVNNSLNGATDVYDQWGNYRGRVTILEQRAATGGNPLTVRVSGLAVTTGDQLVNRIVTYQYRQQASGTSLLIADGISNTTTPFVSGGEYTPAGQWTYNFTYLLNSITRSDYTDSNSRLWGLFSLGNAPRADLFTGIEPVGLPQPDGQGAYFRRVPTGNAPDAPVLNTSVTSVPGTPAVIDTWQTSTWYGKKTYYTRWMLQTGNATAKSTTINASRAIDIDFLGSATSSVNVRSTDARANLLLQGGVINTTGTTTIDSAGTITALGDQALVTGTSINLVARNGIRGTAASDLASGGTVTDTALRVNLADAINGTLSARSTAGDITLGSTSSSLRLGAVDAEAGDVSITAAGGITTSGANQIEGGRISLRANAGSIGTQAAPVLIQAGNTLRDRVTAFANGDIFLRQTSGDLAVFLVEAPNGSVRLEAARDIRNVNGNAVVDTRTREQLSEGLWRGLGLIEGNGYDTKLDNSLRAISAQRLAEYTAYRQFIDQQGGEYNPETLELTARERNYWSEVFSAQGLSQQEIDAELATLTQKRRDEYATLHQSYQDVVPTVQAVRDFLAWRDLLASQGGVYDPANLTLSAAETTELTRQYTAQGLTAAQVSAALADATNARRTSYEALHARFGGQDNSAYDRFTPDRIRTEARIANNMRSWTEDELLKLLPDSARV
jgi:hypothetical protein